MHINSLLPVRAIVAVGQALYVEAEHFAAAGDNIHTVPDHRRRREQAEALPVVDLAGLELGDDQLPEKLTALFVEA